MAMVDLSGSVFSRLTHNRGVSIKSLTPLVYGAVLLGHLCAAQAAPISSRLSVSVQVVRGCHVSTSPTNFARYDSVPAPHPGTTSTRTAITVDCDTHSDGAGMMAITTESGNAGKPTINIFSNGVSMDRAYQPTRIISATADPHEQIIRWGLFPVDARLVLSLPDHELTDQTVLTDGHERTLKLIFDF